MPRHVVAEPIDLPLVLTRDQALAHGITEGRLRHLVDSGRWVTLAPGVYLRAWAAAAEQDRPEAARIDHRRRAVAAAGRRGGSVIAYSSAAVLHGLPLVTGTPSMVQLVVPPGTWTGIRGEARSRSAALDPSDLVVVESPDGVPAIVTSVARTWVDIARTHPLTDALSAGDFALRTGVMTREQAADVLDRLGRARGCRRAAQAMSHLNPLRESALESGSGARFIEWGFPEPRLQQSYYDEWGFIARDDFDWPDHGALGFADGLEKYRLDTGRDRRERLQESRLRPHGTVARWGWVDMDGTGIGLFRLLAPLLGVSHPFRRPR